MGTVESGRRPTGAACGSNLGAEGGIYNAGDSTIVFSMIRNNSAAGDSALGGGIYYASGTRYRLLFSQSHGQYRDRNDGGNWRWNLP
ncbi:MAG: hypothetical protein ACFCD0_21375 [Gemmataceae bacterium]